jgi:predicted nucleotidyltransferase/DNA-binding XRE family transcriptional regulator
MNEVTPISYGEREVTPNLNILAYVDYAKAMDIKTIRLQKGLSQKQAAGLLHVPTKTYQNYELGRSRMNSLAGQAIVQTLSNYEPYSFNQGVYPLALLSERIAEVLATEPVSFAYLFGSYAKGQASGDSDVDLLISGSITGLAYFGLGGRLEDALHKKVDLLRLDDLTKNPQLLQEILKTGYRIYRAKDE